MELKAYKVKCVGKDGEEYEVGVMNWYQQQETQPEAKPDPGK